MNGYVFWPANCEAGVVTVVMTEDIVKIFIRSTDDRVLAAIPIRDVDADGIRAVFSQTFGDEECE